ncbi:Uncharacterised protein [Segatella copri]|nr:Uncharacterised protein [Segatella copri]
MPHHRSINEEHHHRRNLSQHRRYTQPYNKIEFLAPIHLPTQANRLHQIICLLAIKHKLISRISLIQKKYVHISFQTYAHTFL